jgi:hypothetical protein
MNWLSLLSWTTVVLLMSIIARAAIPTLQWYAVNATVKATKGKTAEKRGTDQASQEEKPAVWLVFVAISSIATIGLTIYVALVPHFAPPTSLAGISESFTKSMVLWSAGHVCILLSLRRLASAAVFNVTYSSVFTIATVVAAVPVLNESLGWSKGVGAVVLVAGVAVMTLGRSKGKLVDRTWDYAIGIGLAVIGGILTGVAGAYDAEITQTFEVSTYMIFRLGVPVLVITIIFRVKPKDVFEYIRSNWRLALGTSTCITFSAVTFLEAYQVARQIGFLTALLQLNVFITYGFDAWLKEGEAQHYKKALLAMALSFIGVYVMTQKT